MSQPNPFTKCNRPIKQFLEVNLRSDLSDACPLPSAADHCSSKLSFWRNYDKVAKGNVVIKKLTEASSSQQFTAFLQFQDE